MDIIAHGLWAGAAAQWLRHRRPAMSGRMVAAAVVLAVVPDVLPLAPAVAWSLWEPAPLQFLYEHIAALPGAEPEMPAFANELSHHLHCILHSVIVAGAATALLWWARPLLVLPLLGWWLHIALDIPTHSNDYYAVPFLYPFTYWGVNGIAWTAPWLLALNYFALAGAYLWLWRRRGAKLRRGETIQQSRSARAVMRGRKEGGMIELNVPDMTCGHCAATIRKTVLAIDQGASCEVDLDAKRVTVNSAKPPSEFVEAIQEAGYSPTLVRAVG